ncbi:MAG TPA: tetratricopeptide repeat protein [Bellilinea sp.]|nr:tetratricopeptide repeat protein [Bellilinea sp.]
MPVDDSILKEARKAIEQGDRARAKDLLTRQLRRDPDNPDVWLWMSAVVDTPKERAYCLREVLRIDPEHRAAKRGLAMMGELPPEQQIVQPQHLPHRNWQAQLDKAERPPFKLPNKKVLIYGGAGILVLILIGIGIFGPNGFGRRQQASFVPSPYPTATSAPTLIPTATPIPSGPTPPWQALVATYTPTPLYVNTPHPIIEAYSLAIRAYQRGDWEKVILYLNQSIQSEPSSPDLPFLLGEAYRLSGNNAHALTAYDQSLALNTNFGPAFLGRAQARWLVDPSQIDQIQSDLNSARSADPGMPETLTLFGRFYMENGEVQAALDYLNAAAEQNPNAPQVYFYRAQAYLSQNNPAAALADADRAVQLDLTFVPAYQVLGDALQANQRPTDSIVPYEIYLRYTNNPDPAVHVKMGRAYRNAGNFPQALEEFNTALSLVPESAPALLERGLLYIETGDPNRGLEDINAALNLSPDFFEALVAVGQARFVLADYQGAVDQLNQAAERAENDVQRAMLLYWRAQALEPLDTNAALADWQLFLSLPENAAPATRFEFARQHVAAFVTPAPPADAGLVTPTP